LASFGDLPILPLASFGDLPILPLASWLMPRIPWYRGSVALVGPTSVGPIFCTEKGLGRLKSALPGVPYCSYHQIRDMSWLRSALYPSSQWLRSALYPSCQWLRSALGNGLQSTRSDWLRSAHDLRFRSGATGHRPLSRKIRIANEPSGPEVPPSSSPRLVEASCDSRESRMIPADTSPLRGAAPTP
jgi:hypothetical protein